MPSIPRSSPRCTADCYEPLSINARLAAALHALAQVIDRANIDHAGVDSLIEHLWSSITPETFGAWDAYESPTLDTAMGDPLPTDLEQECRRAGIDPADLRRLLENTAEIVYHGLFTVARDAESLAHLRAVEDIAARYGVTLPPAALFSESAWSTRGGWGSRMTPAEVDRWRRLIWPPRE